MPAAAVDTAAPCYKVYLDGTEVGPEIYTDMIAVEVRDSLNLANMFTLNLSNNGCRYSGASEFAEGRVLKVEMGYRDAVESLGEGEIVSIEPVFPLKGADTVTIRAYDRLHRLRFGKKRRAWGSGENADQTYAAVITRIAQDLGLQADFGGDPPAARYFYLFQNNETDIDFVKRIAREIGYEVENDGGSKLIVRKPLVGAAKALSLTWGRELKSFFPRLSTLNQVSAIVVRGWDPRGRRPILGRAKAPDIASKKMTGKEGGPAQTKTDFRGDIAIKIVQNPVSSQEEADLIAKAELNARAMDYLTADATTVGNTRIRAGKVIELKELGATFSGCYYVTESIHTFVPGAGYASAFKVARPSWGVEAPRTPAPPRDGPSERPPSPAQEALDRVAADPEAQPAPSQAQPPSAQAGPGPGTASPGQAPAASEGGEAASAAGGEEAGGAAPEAAPAPSQTAAAPSGATAQTSAPAPAPAAAPAPAPAPAQSVWDDAPTAAPAPAPAPAANPSAGTAPRAAAQGATGQPPPSGAAGGAATGAQAGQATAPEEVRRNEPRRRRKYDQRDLAPELLAAWDRTSAKDYKPRSQCKRKDSPCGWTNCCLQFAGDLVGEAGAEPKTRSPHQAYAWTRDTSFCGRPISKMADAARQGTLKPGMVIIVKAHPETQPYGTVPGRQPTTNQTKDSQHWVTYAGMQGGAPIFLDGHHRGASASTIQSYLSNTRPGGFASYWGVPVISAFYDPFAIRG